MFSEFPVGYRCIPISPLPLCHHDGMLCTNGLPVQLGKNIALLNLQLSQEILSKIRNIAYVSKTDIQDIKYFNSV